MSIRTSKKRAEMAVRKASSSLSKLSISDNNSFIGNTSVSSILAIQNIIDGNEEEKKEYTTASIVE